MAELTFESGRLHSVWYKVGERTSDRSPKLRRANFDVLTWGAAPSTRVDKYVLPLGFERVADADLNDLLVPTADAREAVDVGQEFGFYDDKSIVLESAFTNDSENFFGLHSFGLI